MIQFREQSITGDILITTDDVIILEGDNNVDYIKETPDVVIKSMSNNLNLVKIKNDPNIYQAKAVIKQKDDIRLEEPLNYYKVNETYVVEKFN